MPFLKADDGCELWYEVHGSGPAIAFASGFMGITDIWRAQIDALAPRYRCIAFDNRGAGRSEKPFPRIAYGVERHARDLACVLAHLGIDRVVLVGHSMGGNTACLFTLSHPQAVRGLVMVGSYVSWRQIVGAGNTLEKIKAAVREKKDRVEFYKAVGLPEHIALESAKWELYAVMGNAESFMQFDVSERLGEIRCPALVLHGTHDIVTPLDPCGHSLRDGLPDARLEIFQGVNHCPMTEDAEKTNRLVLQFLDQRIVD